MWSLSCTIVSTLHHLTYSLHVLYNNLEPAALSTAVPSSHHTHLKHRPYKQSCKHLYGIRPQQALLHAPIGQYRSHDTLLLIPCRVYLILLLYPLLNIALSLDHSIIKPCSSQAPLHIVFLYLLMFWSWRDVNFTLPYNIVFTLLILIYYKYLLVTLQYTSFEHFSIQSSTLQGDLTHIAHLDIALVLLNYFCFPHHCHYQGLCCCP